MHNEEPNNLYFSLNIIRVTKSRRIWAERVGCMGEMKNAEDLGQKAEGFLFGNMENNMTTIGNTILVL